MLRRSTSNGVQKTANKAKISKRTLVLLARATVTVTTYILKSLSKKGGKT
jgi:hypothetical protein